MTKTKRNLEYLDPCAPGIRAHSFIKHIPQWEEEDERFIALCVDLENNEVIQPVLMTAKHEVVDPDSRERWRAAKRLQLEEIPVVIVGADEVANAVLSSLLHRRHLTVSARAYLAFPLMKAAYDERIAKHHERLRSGQRGPSSTQRNMVDTVDKLAKEYGFSQSTFYDAKKVHEIFARDPEYKAQCEPKILQEQRGGEHEHNLPMGLGGVIAGWGGRGSTKDKDRPTHGQLALFTNTFIKDAHNRWEYWQKMDREERREVLEDLRTATAKLSTDACEALAELHAKLAETYREQLKLNRKEQK